MVRRSRSSDVGTGALTKVARSSWDWYCFEALAAAAAAAPTGGPPGRVLVMLAVLPARCPGVGPVMLLPLTMCLQLPSALNVTTCGSYAVGIRAATRYACSPRSGIT